MLVSYSSKFVSNRFLYATGEYANKGDWNGKGKLKQIAITNNTKLKDLGDEFIRLTDQGIFDKEILKAELDKIKDPEKNKPGQTNSTPEFKSLVEFAEYLLKNEPVYYSTSAQEKKNLTKATIKSKTQAIERLKDFQNKYKYTVTFENCDKSFWNQFFTFLKNRKLSKGTRGRIVKDLRSFLNNAVDRGFEVNLDYKRRGIAPTERSEKKLIYLNEDEIVKIANLDLKDRPGLINSRDWLLLAAGTGLRHSDLMRLDKSNIISNEYGKSIRILTQKTSTLVEVPIIFNWLENILIRRKFTFPPSLASQKLNYNFKIIGELAGLNRLVNARVRLEDPETGKLKDHTELADVPIWQALSSHIGRRSFVSILVRKKLPLTLLSKMTGHSKLETLQIYEQLNESETAEAVFYMLKDNKSEMKVS
jgi:site-specific recombinase XerD